MTDIDFVAVDGNIVGDQATQLNRGASHKGLTAESKGDVSFGV